MQHIAQLRTINVLPVIQRKYRAQSGFGFFNVLILSNYSDVWDCHLDKLVVMWERKLVYPEQVIYHCLKNIDVYKDYIVKDGILNTKLNEKSSLALSATCCLQRERVYVFIIRHLPEIVSYTSLLHNHWIYIEMNR